MIPEPAVDPKSSRAYILKLEAERDQLREENARLRKSKGLYADSSYVLADQNEDLRAERDRYRAALERIAALDGGYPDDYGTIAREALRGDPTEAPPICLLPDCDLPLHHGGDHVIHLPRKGAEVQEGKYRGRFPKNPGH